MSNIEFPLASLAALDRKARVEALLDRYLEGLDFHGALERAKGLGEDGPGRKTRTPRRSGDNP
jgi:hypothetical protein